MLFSKLLMEKWNTVRVGDGAGKRFVPTALRVRSLYGVHKGTIRGYRPCEPGM